MSTDNAGLVTEEMALRALHAYDYSVARAHPMQNRTAAMRTALIAALSAMWRPISEAPRDGTKIWAYLPDFDENAVLYRYSSSDGERSCWLYEAYTLNDCLNIELEPSHFMPLPAPPTAAGGG